MIELFLTPWRIFLVSIEAIAHKFKMIETKAGKIPPKPSVKDFEAYQKYRDIYYQFHAMKRFYLISIYHEKVFPEGDPLRKLKL